MKTHLMMREAAQLGLAAFATASIFALAPLARAQQTPPPTTSPAPASTDQSDIFDAIKKGADKLQREARKTRDVEPQLRQIAERQDEFIRQAAEVKKSIETQQKEVLEQLAEAKRQLTAALAKQQEELGKLTHAVEQIEAQNRAAEEKQEARRREMEAMMKARRDLLPAPPAFPFPPAPPAIPAPPAPKAGALLPVTEPPVKPLTPAAPAPSPQP